MLGSRRILSSVVLALAVILALPGFAGAETWNQSAGSKPHPEVAEQLKDFKFTAVALQHEADRLQTLTRNPLLSWQSHSYQHTTVKEHINKMGKMLTELESQKPVASETQRLAIEQVRPHLAEAAQKLTEAMELVQERRGHVRLPDYSQAVGDLYEHTQLLSEKLDTILDYENSRLRFESLELQPAVAPSPAA